MPQSFYNIHRRQVLQLLAGASGAVLLHACNSSSESTKATPTDSPATTAPKSKTSLSLGTAPWVGQVPLYIAQEKGFFAEEGLDFELRNFGDSGGYLSAFLANKLDSLSLVSSEAVTLLDQGKDYKIVLIQDNSTGGDGILAKNSVASIADFKGKKVAVDTSGVSYFFLLQVLKEAGLTKDDITAINTEPSAAASAYQTGSVDIAVTYAPYLKEAAEAVKDGRIIYDSSKMPTAIIDMYIFDSAYVEKNPEAVQAFVNGIFKGMAFLKENPEEALKISSVALDVKPADVESDLKGVDLPDKETNLKMMSEPDSDLYVVKPLKDLSDFLLSEGQIKSEPKDFTTVLDPQFVKASS